MNENERIDTTNKNHKVRWRTQDENMRWITTETKCGPNFQYKNFSVILNFGFPPLLANFERHCLYGFFSILAAILRKNSDKRPWIESGEDLAVHSLTWPSGAKGKWQQLIGDIKHT